MNLTGPVQVRELDRSLSLSGSLTKWQQRVALVDLEPDAVAPAAGASVEIECGPILFLGTVESRDGTHLRIDVEHSVDRRKLDWIQKVWQAPGRA